MGNIGTGRKRDFWLGFLFFMDNGRLGGIIDDFDQVTLHASFSAVVTTRSFVVKVQKIAFSPFTSACATTLEGSFSCLIVGVESWEDKAPALTQFLHLVS